MATSTGAGLGWYLDKIKETPLLSAKEERQLARRVREHSDPIAREQMIQANLRLVVKIAKDYSSPGMTLGDLVAEGNLGLLRAVEEFDPEQGVRFSTYAAWWIKQSIKRALINAGQPIHIPAYLVKLIRKWRRAHSELENALGRPPTVKEMSKKLSITAKKADIIRQGLLAVNAPSQMGAEETQAISEVIADQEGVMPEQNLLDESTRPLVNSLLDRLPDREQRILRLRFGIEEHPKSPNRTYKEIGTVIGLTRERVRQLEKKALAGLKDVVEELL
ncbi:MAG: RNA polymerase sigma factor RpoD/SigA [Phycisphaerae bacterium]